ncbi:MAG: beta-ketoacyl-ACP synthase II [Clostridia bacterium]|nr:beta-ketoacyl-ACP synthase II [Clostridia bacterium]
MSERRVVITGLGAITPLGNSVEECWNSLIEGKNGIAPITQFDTSRVKAKLAGEVKDFDPLKYMSKIESLRSDRNAQFAVGAATQAVEDSNIMGNIDPDRFGVYMGSGVGGIKTFETEFTKLIERGPNRVSPFFVPMMIANMASGMVAIKFDCRNSVMPAVTACASGSHAIGEAMRAIRHGYADAIIAGGAEAPICEGAVAGFVNICALTLATDPNEASLPFDKRRGGFVMGEGAVALVLEEYEHAKKRGAKIYGELVGYGTTCDAYHITAPHPEARGGAQAMINAMKEANYKESDVVYVNAHGTGTPMNDAIETRAIKIALGEEKAKQTYISSTKSMTGHMLGAAGAIEALACILALKEGVIPPTINLKEHDEACDLNYVPNKAVKVNVDLALSNSLGFGGHNACLAFRRI